MAQLKDSIITGSLRVTDTIYTTNETITSLTASAAVVSDANKKLVSRTILNNTSAAAVNGSDSLITANTLVNAGYVKSSGVTSITLTSGAGITISDSGTAITSTGSRTISITGINTSSGSETQCLTKKGTWKDFTANTGTVTSVQVQASSPLTSSSSSASSTTLSTTISFSNQAHNTVLAGPSGTSAADTAPTFRALVADDIPALTYAGSTSSGGAATTATTTADTSSTLYLVGVTSSATTTLKRDTSITMKGALISGNLEGKIKGVYCSGEDEASTTALITNTESGYIQYFYGVSRNATGIFPCNTSSSTNAVITFSTGQSNNHYGHQIGFSTNKKLYHRCFINETFTSDKEWKQIAFTDSDITGTAANVTGTVAIANGGTGLSSADPHKILIGPSSGSSAAAPTWRTLVDADIPTSLTLTSISAANNMTISTTDSSKTIKISAASTLYLESGKVANASIIFSQGTSAAEIARFDTSGNFVPASGKTNTIGTSSLPWTNIYATTFTGDLSGNATSASALAVDTTALTDANSITHVTKGGIIFKQGNASTINGPRTWGNYLHFHWFNSSNWDTQLYLPEGASHSLAWRAHSDVNTWDNWKTIIDSDNINTYRIEIIRL